jgi:hypothetical protein
MPSNGDNVACFPIFPLNEQVMRMYECKVTYMLKTYTRDRIRLFNMYCEVMDGKVHAAMTRDEIQYGTWNGFI